jgi:hypothetical protein
LSEGPRYEGPRTATAGARLSKKEKRRRRDLAFSLSDLGLTGPVLFQEIRETGLSPKEEAA